MTRTIDMSPDTHFLESIRAQKSQYHLLLGEAVDNSFDAGSRNINIAVDDQEIIIEDDGIGVSRDRWEAMVRLGQHMPTTGTALGRYGVGIKYQAISAGDRLSVVSRSVADGEMRLRVNWAEILRTRSWKIEEPVWRPLRDKNLGTTVTISALRRTPRAAELERAKTELAHMFFPALASGSSITFNGQAISITPDPETRDTIEMTVEVAQGKGAWVRAGILQNSKSKTQGVQVSFKHRVIKPRSGFGCGDYSTIGLFARIDLFGPWGLATFKNDINDEDEDALEDRVHEILLPILQQCSSAFMSANVAEMQSRLNALLPPELAAVRPPKVKEHGRQGEKRKRIGEAPGAPESATGPARSRFSHNQLVIEFTPSFEEDGYGRFEKGRTSRIFMAEDNPHIALLLRQRDKASAERELYLVAMSLYLNDPAQWELPFDGPFGMRFWKLIERQNVISGEAQAA